MKFNVPTIACEGCAETITKAIKVADGEAQVSVDVPAKTVTVKTEISESSIRQAIVGSGHEVAE